MTFDLGPFDVPEPTGPYSIYVPPLPPPDTFVGLSHDELLRVALILDQRNKRQAATIAMYSDELDELREQRGW